MGPGPHKTKNAQISRSIKLDGCNLSRVSDVKFLGITIDENLTWKPHINNIRKTCFRNLGVLNKVKHFLPKNSLYQLYCSLILPYLSYGIVLWGKASKEHVMKIHKLQKRALRIISNSSYLSHTKPLFEKYNALNIFEMYDKEVGIFMYKYKNSLLPQSFDHVFTDLESVHTYDTRYKTNYRPEIHKMKTVLTTGPKIWNNLPEFVKPTVSVNSFKKVFHLSSRINKKNNYQF